MADEDELPLDGEPDGDETEPDQQSAAVTAKQVRRKRVSAEVQQRQGDDFWRNVLANPIGRLEIWKLLQTAGTFTERFQCGPNGFPQSEATWFAAGEQSFGQRWYQALLALDLEGVRLMHLEHDHRFARFVPKDGK